MKMEIRAGSQALFRQAGFLDFPKRDRFGFTYPLLHIIDGVTVVFCVVVFCDQELYGFIRSIRQLQKNRDYQEPNGPGKHVDSNKVEIRRVLTFARRTYPAMAIPISMMMMRETTTANQEKTKRGEVNDKSEE